MQIPKIIHHIWMGKNEIPDENINCANSVKKIHSDFEYKLWKDIDINNLIKNEFPEYYDRFYELPRMIMKIDMFRYFLMYKFGGLYTDMDYLMFKPFDLLEYKIVIPTNMDRDKNGNVKCLGNCIFASVPNHPFWKNLMDTLLTIDRKNLPSSGHQNVVNSTGPMFVFNMYNSYNNKEDIYIPLERLSFHPPSKRDPEYINKLRNNTSCYGLHFCTGLWGNDKL